MNTWHPGDVVFFAGRGPVSWFIALITLPFFIWAFSAAIAMLVWWPIGLAILAVAYACSKRITHCGIIVRYEGRMLLLESTTLCDLRCAITGRTMRGVQAHSPLERINRYSGRVYLAALREDWRLNEAQVIRLGQCVRSLEGRPYSSLGALVAGTRVLKWYVAPLRRGLHHFCSELVAYCLKYIDRFPTSLHSSTVHPAGLARVIRITEYFEPLRRIK